MATYDYTINFNSNLDEISEKLNNIISQAQTPHDIKFICDTKDIERALKLIKSIKSSKAGKISLGFDSHQFKNGLSNLEQYAGKSAEEISEMFKKQMSEAYRPKSLKELMGDQEINKENVKQRIEDLTKDIGNYRIDTKDFLGIQEQMDRINEMKNLIEEAKKAFGDGFVNVDKTNELMGLWETEMSKMVGNDYASPAALEEAARSINSAMDKAKKEFADTLGVDKSLLDEDFSEVGGSADKMAGDIASAVEKATASLTELTEHAKALHEIFSAENGFELGGLTSSLTELSGTIDKVFNLSDEGNDVRSVFEKMTGDIEKITGKLEEMQNKMKALSAETSTGNSEVNMAEVEYLERLSSALQGIPEDALTGIQLGMHGVSEEATKFSENIDVVVEALQRLDEVLKGAEGSVFLGDLHNVLSKGEELSNFAKILKESSSKIKEAQNALGNTQQLEGAKFLNDNENAIRDRVNKHFEGIGSVKSTQMSVDKNGLVQVRAIVESLNGDFKDYTMTVDSAFDVTINKVTEGTSALERMKAATEMLNTSGAENFTWTPDSEGWETLRVAVVEYEQELGKLQSITRSLRQDNNGNWLESFKLKGEKGSKTIGPRLDDEGMPSIVAETSNIAMIEDIEKKYTQSLKNMTNSAKQFNAGNDTLINKSAFEEANAELDNLEAELKELVQQEIITQNEMDEIVNKRKKANAQIDENPITDKEYLQAQKDMERLYKELGDAKAERTLLESQGLDSSATKERIDGIVREIAKIQELCAIKEKELSLTKQQQMYNADLRTSNTSSSVDEMNDAYNLKLIHEEQNMRNRQLMSEEEKRNVVSSVSKDFESGKYEADITKLRDSFMKAGQSADYAENQVEELRTILSEIGNATGIDEIVEASQRWSAVLQSIKNDLVQVQSANSMDKMVQSNINNFHSALDKYASSYRASMRDEGNEEKYEKARTAAQRLLMEEDNLRQLARDGSITNDQLESFIDERNKLLSRLGVEEKDFANQKFDKTVGNQSEESEYKKNLAQLEKLYKDRARLEEMIARQREAGKVTDSMEADYANINSDISALEKRTVELEKNVVAEDRLADAISKRESRMQEAETQGRREGERAISSATDREINKNLAKAQKGITTTLANDSGQKTIGFMLSQFQKFRATSEEARADVERLQSAYNELGSSGSKSAQEQIAAWERYQQVLKETELNLKNLKKNSATIDQRNSLIADIEKFRANNTRAEKNFGGQFDALEKELRESEGSMEHFRAQWKALQADITSSGQTGLTFMSSFGNRFRESLLTAFSYVSIYDFWNVFRQGFEQVKELDTALTEMRKVSDESLQSLQRYQNLTFDFAGEIGTTALQLQQSTADWMRLGESLTEAQESAQVSNILFNVSEFESIDEATESLVSMSAAYKDLDKIEIVDKLNNIGRGCQNL